MRWTISPGRVAVKGVKVSRRRASMVFAASLVSAILVGPTPALATSLTVYPPLSGATDYITDLPSCSIGPVGLLDDGTNFFVTDWCNETTYKFSAATGGSALSPPLAVQNGLSHALVESGGTIYGVASRGLVPSGIYSMDPSTLMLGANLLPAPCGDIRGLIADPQSGGLFLTGDCGLFRLQLTSNPTGIAVAQKLSTDNLDGIALSPDANGIWVADFTTSTVTEFDRSGAVITAISTGHPSDGIAIAGADAPSGVAGNVFVNDNDGTIVRIDTNNGDAVSVVGSGGSRGDFVTVGPDQYLYATQTDEVVKIAPNIFVPALTPPAITSVSPGSGPWSGGTPLTVRGSGFLPGDHLCFYTGPPLITAEGGCAPPASTTINSSTELTATSPALPSSSAHSVEYYVGIERCCNGLSLIDYTSTVPFVFSQPWSLGSVASRVVVNPHVAYVLVGDWWCPLYGSRPPKGICSTGSARKINLTTQATFTSTLASLVRNDYFDYAGSYDSALSYYHQGSCTGTVCGNTYVGSGITLRTAASGDTWAGPVDPKSVQCTSSTCPEYNTLQGLAPQFGVNTASDVANTVFVLLYAPNLVIQLSTSSHQKTNKDLHCDPNQPLSWNGPVREFATASVYLEDQNDYCSSAAAQGLFSAVGPMQWATWLTTHELDEAITNPTVSSSGWLVNNYLEIADPCQLRSLSGDTSPTLEGIYNSGNFATDSLGTVVAAYVDPLTGFCTPTVATGPPSTRY